MKIVFVASNPSVKNKDPLVPLEGTKSEAIFKAWVRRMELQDYQVVNVTDKTTPKNRKLRVKEYELDKLEDKIAEADKVIALGETASDALNRINAEHFLLPHPSPLNRMLNDPDFIDRKLFECLIFLKSS